MGSSRKPQIIVHLSLSFIVSLLWTLTTNPTHAAGRSIVQSITASNDSVALSLSGPVAFQRATLPANLERGLPNRCYVDISPAILGGRIPSFLPVNTPGIQRIRVSQFRPETVRVVLDLSMEQPCWVTASPATDQLQITLGAAPGSEINTARPKTSVTRLTPTQPTEHITTTIPSETDTKAQAQPSKSSPTEPSPQTATQPESAVLPTTPSTKETDPAKIKTLVEGTSTSLTASPTEETDTAQALSLEEAYRAALTNEEQIKIAGRELAKAQLMPWRAITQLTPRVDITGTYTRNKEELAFQFPEAFGGAASGGSAIRPLEIWQGIFGVTQPILQPSFFPSRQLGKDTVRQSEQQYDFTVREVLLGVARAYYDVLRTQAQIEVAQETLRLTKDQLRQARVRVRVGEVTETDALRAEVEVAQAEQTLITTQQNRRFNATVLARAIGVFYHPQVVEPTPPQVPTKTYDQLLDVAYQNRQDLRAREFSVNIARQRKNLVLTRYAPQVDTHWRFDRRDTETFAERDKFWTLFLNFRVPLFDGGVREIDLMEQEENLGQAQLQVDQLRKDIAVDVHRALVLVETLGATLETLKKQRVFAQRNYDITSKQYGVGEATSLDVNNTLNTLNQVRTNLTNQTYAYQFAILSLEHAIGTFGQSYAPQP